jgi:hypothetical protein
MSFDGMPARLRGSRTPSSAPRRRRNGVTGERSNRFPTTLGWLARRTARHSVGAVRATAEPQFVRVGPPLAPGSVGGHSSGDGENRT